MCVCVRACVQYDIALDIFYIFYGVIMYYINIIWYVAGWIMTSKTIAFS